MLEAEELHSVAVLQLDLEKYEDAEKTLTILLQMMPYDENVLHKTGYARLYARRRGTARRPAIKSCCASIRTIRWQSTI